MIMRGTSLVAGAMLIVLAATAGPARAAVMTFTDSVAFQAATAGFQPSTTLDFEAQAAGTTIPSGNAVEGVTFNQTIGFDLIVDNFGSTTSGTNYLGVDDGVQFQFVGGDGFTMDFGTTIHAVGLFAIGAPGSIFDGDITLGTGAGSGSNAALPEMVLVDGSDAFFIGLIDTAGFQTAALSSFAANYVFAVDDITYAAIPVPGAVYLFLSALFALGGASAFRRRRAV